LRKRVEAFDFPAVALFSIPADLPLWISEIVYTALAEYCCNPPQVRGLLSSECGQRHAARSLGQQEELGAISVGTISAVSIKKRLP